MSDKRETNLAVIARDIEYIKQEIQEIKLKLEADYITRQEFNPVKNLVYGLVTMILIGVVGALMALVLK